MNPSSRVIVAVLAVLYALPIQAQPAPAGHQPDEVATILATLDRYMDAISKNDLRAQEQMQTPEGMAYRASVDQAGRWTVRARSNAASVAPSMNDGRTYRERYWYPAVLVRGAIAVVWAPYEFWINGATNHCGIDVFTFVKIDGVWRVANSMWTVEPNACGELRPRDATALRP